MTDVGPGADVPPEDQPVAAPAHEGGTGRDPGRDRPQRTVPVGAFAIPVLVAAALAVLAVFALVSDTGSGGGDEDREVRLAAGRFSERFLTFEHDDLDAWKEDVLALATSGFAEEVEEVESGLRTLIAESELDAVTQVTDLFVGEVERGAVDVVVVYDRELRGGQVRTESDRYLQLAMVRIDGEWLVDNVIDLAFTGAPAGTPAPPGVGSTTTSEPASRGG